MGEAVRAVAPAAVLGDGGRSEHAGRAYPSGPPEAKYPVMFWQNGFDDKDGMTGVRHLLTSTGAVRICTGKTE